MDYQFNYHEAETSLKVKYLFEFTSIYKSFETHEITGRELAILHHQIPAIFLFPEKEDLITGRMKYPPLVFAPQAQAAHGGYAYVYDREKAKLLRNSEGLSASDIQILDELDAFWIKEDTSYRTRQAYPSDIAKWLPSDNWTGESGVAFPLYRMSGSQPDYEKLLKYGINGLRKILKEKSRQFTNESTETRFYKGAEAALDILSDLCLFYSEKIDLLINDSPETYRTELVTLRNSLESISNHAPTGFSEAVQLVHLYALVSGCNNYGRMDDYLAPFYQKDIEMGLIDEERAGKILESLWRLINFRKIIWDGRVIIGGKGRKNSKEADKLSLVIMETTRKVKDVLPQLTLRWYDGMDEQLFSKAMEVISEGNTYPMLYNDDVNIPSVSNAFNVDEKTAEQYVPFGCGEYVLNHRSFGTPSGVINLLKILEITLHRGKDLISGRIMGIEEANSIEPDSFKNLCLAYQINVTHYLNILARQEKFEYEFASKTAPFLFLSLLFNSCIEKGKALFDGGIDHLGGTIETYGNTNTSDSLLAILKLVYETGEVTLEKLVEIMDNDFRDAELFRKKCLEIPKYGNDHPEADAMMLNVHEKVCKVTMKLAEKHGLDSYLVVNINNNANTILGRFASASADGRKSGSPMANGNTPSPGMDKNGATALLNSLVKMRTDIHAGASQNIKFSKEMLTLYMPMTKALIKTYFANGGAQLMITAVGREDLENALKDPENYHNLLVRVGGFSARFVELERDVQLEILNRTLY